MVKNNSDKYQKLTHKEHVLLRPNMYVGSVVNETKSLFVVDDPKYLNSFKITNKTVSYNGGFLKIFDEILVNASDHSIRTDKVKYIKVDVTKDSISVENDGPGIPIEMHNKEKCYIPELIFGHLLTGSNFDKNEDKYWGGLHGLGAKLTNIFSKKFIIETCDGKKHYTQIFENNLNKINKPKIKSSKKQYTKITYYPDFTRFDLVGIDEDIESIFIKRCIDVSVYCSKVKVYYNGNLIPTKSFKSYMEMFVSDQETFYEKINDFWEIGVSKSLDNSFDQISMVNAISTYNGGTHVNAITNQITKRIQESLLKKNKKLNIKQNDIKNRLFVFVNLKVANPVFDTQSKENLISKINAPDVSDILIKKITSSSMIDELLKFLMIKEEHDTKKEIGKHKIKISKLEDARKAGTSESKSCLIFISEGDSASSSVMAGISGSDNPEYYGVFPIRGKILNVRDEDLSKIRNNEEVKNIINILGLEYGKQYTDTSKLRYGKIVLTADADCDGNHIRGLIINLFDTYWPELLRMDFIYDFITPIVKATKGNNIKYYYSLKDYQKNKENLSGYEIKWIKGLGTIEPHEMKNFFKNINKHLIRFHDTPKSDTKNMIDLVFNKKRSDDRKEWLKNYKPIEYIDKFTTNQTYDKFINNELMEWSMETSNRMIPNIMDGLKPGQRKVIYTMYKKNMKTDIKVSSLSGAVIQESAYHHGNVSIEGTIIGMAQDFVGSNNLNLILPKGQFGSRLKGGKDSASARYIFTKLNDITSNILKKEDNDILEYQNDDGFPIEPTYYVPVIPMILVNGGSGIGSAYSTDIPSFSPLEIITYLQNKIKGKKNIELIPYYKEFKGTIELDIENKRYITRGILNRVNDITYEIKELPLWMWNDSYYEFLDDLSEDKKEPKTQKLIRKAYIRDWVKSGNDKDIHIKIYFYKDVPKEFFHNIWKNLKMESYISFNNMYLWDENKKIKKYSNQYEIIDDFYKIRLEYYTKRKNHQIEELKKDIKIVQNRMKFLKNVIDGNLIIYKKTRDIVEKDLDKLAFDKVDNSYGYLLNMSIMSFTKDRLQELKEELDNTKLKLKELVETSEETIWLKELSELKSKLKF